MPETLKVISRYTEAKYMPPNFKISFTSYAASRSLPCIKVDHNIMKGQEGDKAYKRDK